MKKLNTKNAHLPMPVTLVGAMDGEIANFAAVGWICRVNAMPPMLGLSLNRQHHTNNLIKKNKYFSVCLPTQSQLAKVDHCGIVSGVSASKDKVFDYCNADNPAIPLIKDAALSVACKLVEIVKLPTNEFFIGEITGVWANDKALHDNGSINFQALEPFFLSMPDNRYWSLGAELGKAWNPDNRQINAD